MSPDQAFARLGLPVTASSQDVRLRWRQLAAVHHPDRGGDAGTFTDMRAAMQVALEAAQARETRCPRCQGLGTERVTHGFSRMVLPCPVCQGRGKLD